MLRFDVRVGVTLVAMVLGIAGGCTATGKNQGNQGGDAGSGGSGNGGSASGGDGGGFVMAGSGGNGGACVADKQQGMLVKQPVDLIMVVDTSGTMEPASDAVEQTINQNLAAALTAANVDYRLIVLASYGSGTDLCIGPPLGGAACSNPPAQPANTSNFYHYVRLTGSGELLNNIVNWYNAPDDSGTSPNGWKAWLRPDAKKVFLVFSDTSSASSAQTNGDQFDANLRALDPATFGTENDRKYTFHSIIGLRENTPATSPWLPTDPLVEATCTGFNISLAPGQSLQRVSILSKGLRFPVCQFAGFDVVFQQIAQDVVQKTELACDIPFPTPPAGETIDPNTIQLVYTNNKGVQSTFGQVKGLADCKPDAFYVEGQVIHLSPAACDTVKIDAMGSIDVQFGCDVGFAK